MAHGDFVWCDLSTFNADNTKHFYARLFGWTYEPVMQPDGILYYVASTAGAESAALFAMPDKYKRIGLPSFWMSYVQVNDVNVVVAQANALGGNVEIGPIPYGDNASIALIRDPLGAGFTVYQGDELQPRQPDPPPGHMAWNALYVSEAQPIIEFYEALFDWQIVESPTEAGVFKVFKARGREVAAIHEADDRLRGEFQFWGVHFAVADVKAVKAQVLAAGGNVLYEGSTADDSTVLAKDPDGAGFFLSRPPQHKAPTDQVASSSSFKWKTGLAIAVIWIAVILESIWLWGVLFIMWTVPALRPGQIYLIEPIHRNTNPFFYWFVVGTWIVLSLFLVIYDLVPSVEMRS